MRRITACPVLVLLFLPCISAYPATILLSVMETVDGAPAALPPPATEGIFDGLFEAGNIVFNTRDGTTPSISELMEIASGGGAQFILKVSVSFTSALSGGSLAGLKAEADIALLRTDGNELIGRKTLLDDNRGREGTVDLSKLGFELGVRIANEAQTMLSHAADP
jgi:hypothetical protein